MGRVLRKEADDVLSKWDRLNADSADWQRRLELALKRLAELQEAENQLDTQLRQAEMVKEAWEPVGELLIDSLPEHIDRVKVKTSSSLLTSWFQHVSLDIYCFVFLVKEFQEELNLIKEDVTHMNQLAAAFDPSDIQLSTSNLERIEDLNMRWKRLQVGIQTQETKKKI